MAKVSLNRRNYVSATGRMTYGCQIPEGDITKDIIKSRSSATRERNLELTIRGVESTKNDVIVTNITNTYGNRTFRFEDPTGNRGVVRLHGEGTREDGMWAWCPIVKDLRTSAQSSLELELTGTTDFQVRIAKAVEKVRFI